MSLKRKLSIVAALSATIIAVVSAIAGNAVVGHEARLVDVIGLLAGGFGAGAGLTAALVTAKTASPRRIAGNAPRGSTSEGG